MITKNPHIHAEFLAEAVQDTNRKIEGKRVRSETWELLPLSFVAGADSLWEFRFADTVNRIVSSLTDDELFAIADEHASHNEDVNYSVLRAVANAAAQRADEDSSAHTPKTGSVSLRSFKENPCFQPKNFADKEPISPEEMASLYRKTKLRMF